MGGGRKSSPSEPASEPESGAGAAARSLRHDSRAGSLPQRGRPLSTCTSGRHTRHRESIRWTSDEKGPLLPAHADDTVPDLLSSGLVAHSLSARRRVMTPWLVITVSRGSCHTTRHP